MICIKKDSGFPPSFYKYKIVNSKYTFSYYVPRPLTPHPFTSFTSVTVIAIKHLNTDLGVSPVLNFDASWVQMRPLFPQFGCKLQKCWPFDIVILLAQ